MGPKCIAARDKCVRVSFFVEASRSGAAAAVLFGACYNFLWMVFVIFVICATPLAGSDYSLLLFRLLEEA